MRVYEVSHADSLNVRSACYPPVAPCWEVFADGAESSRSSVGGLLPVGMPVAAARTTSVLDCGAAVLFACVKPLAIHVRCRLSLRQ